MKKCQALIKAIHEKHMTDEQIKMSEERESTIQAGAKIERKSVSELEEMINDKIQQFEYDDDYRGIKIESESEGSFIGTKAYVLVKEGELMIRLNNNRTDITETFKIDNVSFIYGLTADEDKNTKLKLLWKK